MSVMFRHATTVPPQYVLFAGTVPPCYVLFGGTVPPRYVLFGGTVPPNSFFLIVNYPANHHTTIPQFTKVLNHMYTNEDSNVLIIIQRYERSIVQINSYSKNLQAFVQSQNNSKLIVKSRKNILSFFYPLPL